MLLRHNINILTMFNKNAYIFFAYWFLEGFGGIFLYFDIYLIFQKI